MEHLRTIKSSEQVFLDRLQLFNRTIMNLIPNAEEYIYLNDKIATYTKIYSKGYKAPLFSVNSEHLVGEVCMLPRACINQSYNATKFVRHLNDLLPRDIATFLDIKSQKFVIKSNFCEMGKSVYTFKKGDLNLTNIKKKIPDINSPYKTQIWYMEHYCSHFEREHRFYVLNGKVHYCVFSFHKRLNDGDYLTTSQYLDEDELIIKEFECLNNSPNPFLSYIKKSAFLRNTVNECISHVFKNYMNNNLNAVPVSSFFLRIDASIIFKSNRFIILLKEIEPITTAFYLLTDIVGEIDIPAGKFKDIIKHLANIYKNLIFQNACLFQKNAAVAIRLFKKRTKDPKDIKIKPKKKIVKFIK